MFLDIYKNTSIRESGPRADLINAIYLEIYEFQQKVVRIKHEGKDYFLSNELEKGGAAWHNG